MINKIVLASNNKNKIEEIKSLLSNFGVEIKSLKDLNLDDPIENGKDFKENSLIKARYAFEKTGLPTLADDSGFCIDILNDFPGLFSARFAKASNGYENAFKIINQCLEETNNKDAHFTTCLSFIYNSNDKIIEKIFEGKLEGQFTYPPRGNNGFGYCPCFTPKNYTQTFSEMTDDFRSKINHRAIALNKFIEFFKSMEQK